MNRNLESKSININIPENIGDLKYLKELKK